MGDNQIDIYKMLPQIINKPVIKVDRAKFLRKELKLHYPESIVEDCIIYSPAYAGIPLTEISNLAKTVINYETLKVSSLSFAAGLPGGLAIIGTVPLDTTQYFVFILRVLQKLAYLYSFPDFNLNEDNIDDDTLNQLIIFMGVMFGVEGASTCLRKIAANLSVKTANNLARKALTKGAIYPIVKTIAQKLGSQMTKQIFSDTVGKSIPIVGGVICGGLSYATFKPCSYKLKKKLETLPICQPEFYD